MLAAVLWAGGLAAGDVVVQSWGVGERASHPKSIKIVKADAGAAAIRIDLAALFARQPKIYQARLLASREPITGADDEAMVKVEVFPLSRPFVAGGSPPKAAKPLRLIAPWYDSFDVTETVRSCVAAKSECWLYVKAFPKWRQETTALEVTCEGDPPARPPPAVTALRVFHRAGQTFITWKEIENPFGDKPVTLGDLTKAKEDAQAGRRVRYRVYRHGKPVNGRTLAQAELLAEVEPLSGYNDRGVSVDRLIHQHQRRAITDSLFARSIARGPFRGYHPGMPQMSEVLVDRLAIEDGKPLPPGTGLYVHHPAKAQDAYYAVVTAIDGTANTTALGPGAAGVKAVKERPGHGAPVFQGTEDLKVFYDYPGQRRRYVQWCAPPLANRPNQCFNWGVYVPPAPRRKLPPALGVYFHDTRGLYLRPPWPHPHDMVLISPHQAPRPGFGYGYHESLGTLRSCAEGAVRDYTARRIDAVLDWACRTFGVDRNRMSCHGAGALGGSAALHYALRRPERFALVVAGQFDADPKSTPSVVGADRRRVRTHLPAIEAVWGKKEWDLKNADGKSVWSDRDMVAFVRACPEANLPFMSLGTGSQHITWPQENALLKALWQTKQPFRTDFTWGGHAPHYGPLYARRDRLMLAASPDQASLERARWHAHDRWQKAVRGYWGGGTINMDVSWSSDDIVDTPDRLEVTGRATGNVTIRNAQAFKLKPGEKVRWRMKTGRPNEPKGEATADANGLLTVPSLRGRLIVTRATGEAPKQEGKEE